MNFLPGSILFVAVAVLVGLSAAQSGWSQSLFSTGGIIDSATRDLLLVERRQAITSGDSPGLARVHAKLVGDAFARTAGLTTYWLDRRDSATGLFPTSLKPGGHVWTYEDAASDLFPFLAIGSWVLVPERYDEILETLTSEQRRSPGLPRDIALGADPAQAQDEEKLYLGATEYAKDGLLPMVEMLGPNPWLPRLQEVTQSVLQGAHTPTRHGPIVASSTEINGNTLQVLARLYWATRNPFYLEMGNRISRAYLDSQLTHTQDVPAHRWDFIENEPIGPRRFFLGDHGNEIVSGLIEWHRIELEVGSPLIAQHRKGIRELLDKLLTRGRTDEGLWVELIDVPSGRVRDSDLTDNWGYLAQAYLNQAQLERNYPGGDPAIAERYEQEARRALAAAARTGAYQWDGGTMDGFADTIESALYVLRHLADAEAIEWVHQQVGTLLAFQQADGRVTDENIDGNFIRTTLQYGLWLSQGIRPAPWEPGVAVGATRERECLHVHVSADREWSGSLVFDSPRHREHLSLPSDYPRLNQWMEWFTVRPELGYDVTVGAAQTIVSGDTLRYGMPITVSPDQPALMLVCPR